MTRLSATVCAITTSALCNCTCYHRDTQLPIVEHSPEQHGEPLPQPLRRRLQLCCVAEAVSPHTVPSHRLCSLQLLFGLYSLQLYRHPLRLWPEATDSGAAPLPCQLSSNTRYPPQTIVHRPRHSYVQHTIADQRAHESLSTWVQGSSRDHSQEADKWQLPPPGLAAALPFTCAQRGVSHPPSCRNTHARLRQPSMHTAQCATPEVITTGRDSHSPRSLMACRVPHALRQGIVNASAHRSHASGMNNLPLCLSSTLMDHNQQ
jgi:hypothetical protein